ncbi:hypothetical protein ACTFIY_011180 [Dictyostelium cf. discoideum]
MNNLVIIRQPQTQREIYTIIYDIACPHIPGTENPKQYSPSVLLPDDHPQKHWSRNQFYSSLTTHLANLGYEKLQNSNYQKESTLAVIFNDAYSLHTIQGLHWLPFCVKRMHIHKVITENSIYPLQYENPQNINGEGDTDDDDEEMLNDEEYNNF